MKLNVEQSGTPFYDAGKAPPREAAAELASQAVVVGESTAGESPAAPPPDALPDLTIALDRSVNSENGREEFRLMRRIGYDDDSPGGVGPIRVPGDLKNWTTDLTSVPAFLTWLVPKTGAHLPAAILHDGLVLGKNDEREHKGRGYGYIASRDINRDEADRIFRDAMAKTGTGVIRRWMIWAAVTTATMHHGRQVDWSLVRTWHYRIALWGTVLAIVVLGIWCTLDILDCGGVPGVPWIGEDPWEGLLGGFAGAVVIPLALGSTWGTFRVAGWIMGPLFALIVPAIVPIVVIGLAVVGVDQLQKWRPEVAKALAFVFVALALAVFIASWWLA
ncbi:DUF1353 domain-containing protein [Nocardia sp. 2]|uniref:DUF1353 domain-containing protein n=1 Tax=Nocardia acididurans TaxID=2802282 RepID=A0ABS1M8T0_9NOCA|nr:DUF1353 domain-containing protein [Nocardia acididurans]MBL1077062.1 DUF1353 domain-containing protein [Nocardia acididurans]